MSVAAGTTILEAAEKAGIPIPHLCYLKEINEIAACRMCVVEIEGVDRLVPACNTEVAEGMVIHTNISPGPAGPEDQSAADPQPAQLQLHRLRPQRQLPAAEAFQ